jgi:hypothetical protein
MRRRPGRPIEPARPGERVTLTIRVSPDIKGKLEAEANKAARSLSQEAERRIENSFNAEDMMVQMARFLREEWKDHSQPIEFEVHTKPKRRAK